MKTATLSRESPWRCRRSSPRCLRTASVRHAGRTRRRRARRSDCRDRRRFREADRYALRRAGKDRDATSDRARQSDQPFWPRSDRAGGVQRTRPGHRTDLSDSSFTGTDKRSPPSLSHIAIQICSQYRAARSKRLSAIPYHLPLAPTAACLDGGKCCIRFRDFWFLRPRFSS